MISETIKTTPMDTFAARFETAEDDGTFWTVELNDDEEEA